LTLPMLEIPLIVHLANPVEVALGLHLWFWACWSLLSWFSLQLQFTGCMCTLDVSPKVHCEFRHDFLQLEVWQEFQLIHLLSKLLWLQRENEQNFWRYLPLHYCDTVHLPASHPAWAGIHESSWVNVLFQYQFVCCQVCIKMCLGPI
jgi:hypothetical protein